MLRDRRNSDSEIMTFNQAMDGRERGSRHKKYLVWHRWGADNADLGVEEFIQAYAEESRRVGVYNRANFGTDKVWSCHRKRDETNKVVGTFYLTYEAETFLKINGIEFPTDLEGRHPL